MDRWQFEQVCIDSRLKPVYRHNSAEACVLIADGFFQGHPDRPYPHHRTVWAIGRSEDALQIGRSIYTETGDSTLDERIAVACEDALVACVGMERARETLEQYMNPEAQYDG